MKHLVKEAYTRDVGRGVIRVDYDTMDELKTSTGDHVRVNGKSILKILPLHPSDEKKGMARLDGIGRINTGTNIGDHISMEKVKTLPPLTKITFTPQEAIPPIDDRYLVDALDGLPITIGDNVIMPYFGGRLTFKVTAASSNEGFIVNGTTISIIGERSSPPDRKTEFIKKVVSKASVVDWDDHFSVHEFILYMNKILD